MIKINTDTKEVLDTLREIVEANPDKVYAAPEHMVTRDDMGNAVGTSCFYVHTDAETGESREVGCLIGQVLNRLGVPSSALREYEGKGARLIADAVLNFPNETYWDTDRLFGVLSYAQTKQDAGLTWRKAFDYATELYGLVAA